MTHPVFHQTCSVYSDSHGNLQRFKPHETCCPSSGMSMSSSGDAWTTDAYFPLQSMLDKTHSVLQSLIEADSAEGDRSSSDYDALLDKHPPSLNRCQFHRTIVAGSESKLL